MACDSPHAADRSSPPVPARAGRLLTRRRLVVFDRATERPDYRPRPSRGRADLPPVGVFADRGPRRPNRIGMTTCTITSVDGRQLEVLGLDAVTGTPVIDLKPTMIEFQPTNVRQPPWVTSLMDKYLLP